VRVCACQGTYVYYTCVPSLFTPTDQYYLGCVRTWNIRSTFQRVLTSFIVCSQAVLHFDLHSTTHPFIPSSLGPVWWNSVLSVAARYPFSSPAVYIYQPSIINIYISSLQDAGYSSQQQPFLRVFLNIEKNM
jgi:hypothetical protein